MKKIQFTSYYLETLISIISKTNKNNLNKLINRIAKTKSQKGRIFFLGVGGSAANCSHAVNDFRKIANIECYAPSDNVSELTANANDEGWDSIFVKWLEVSNLNKKDLLFIFSVGGGNKKFNVSVNLIKAIDLAIKKNVMQLLLLEKKMDMPQRKVII